MALQRDGFQEKAVFNLSSQTGFRPSYRRYDLEKRRAIAKELKIASGLGWKV